jgi:hypothetical protein
VEHFEWLEPLFNERIEIKDGRMLVPTRPGLGLSLSEQTKAWTREAVEFGKRPSLAKKTISIKQSTRQEITCRPQPTGRAVQAAG